MFSSLFFGVAFAALGVVAQAGGEKPFALQTPGEFVQCKNTTLVWQGGKSPYKVSIKPACGAGQNATEEQHVVLVPGATSIELPVTFPAGTPVVVAITDSSNMQATAPPFTVTSGDANDSCTLQTACNNVVQPPSVPVALAPAETSSTPTTPTIPTDHLLTVDPSASTTSGSATNTAAASSGSGTMVVLYSYIAQTSATSTPSSVPQNNAAVPVKTAPVVVLGCVVLYLKGVVGPSLVSASSG
ncbi:hypothetical protein BDV93DRAFT_542772 [Ceratobasidium sp. AG-I]|nr:hypothetical protein BDV93DRAFT_542772 [Ceratobasidium sp. AG-I]